jgi:hypothetical protein
MRGWGPYLDKYIQLDWFSIISQLNLEMKICSLKPYSRFKKEDVHVREIKKDAITNK